MAVAGALIGSAIGAFGKKPVIPGLEAISPDQVQQQTIAGNQAALPGAEQLASQTNAFSQAQMAKALEFALPGGLAKVQGITNAQLAGQIPADVQQQLFSSSAGQALQGGFGGGSGIGHNLTARDFGLTSMAIQQQGIGNFNNLIGLTKTPMMDVTSMFFSPQQRLSFALQDRSQQFQRDLLAAQVEAAPDPATAALGREVDRFFNTVAGYGMMAAGDVGSMGGGGGGGGGGTSGGGTGNGPMMA